MLSMRLDTLIAKPERDFVDADHQSLCALGDGNGIAHVIPMPVADEDEVGLHCPGGDGSRRIPIQKRIDNKFVPIRFDAKRGVPIPSQFRSHENLLFLYSVLHENRDSQKTGVRASLKLFRDLLIV